MSKTINAYVDSFENLTFNFENQRKRISLVGFMPQQANSNDEKGEVHNNDNSSIKTLVVKFKGDHLKKHGVSTTMLREFLIANYIGKKMLVLPVSEEKQSKKKIGEKYIPLPNQSECTVLEDFDLWKFCGLADKSALENKK